MLAYSGGIYTNFTKNQFIDNRHATSISYSRFYSVLGWLPDMVFLNYHTSRSLAVGLSGHSTVPLHPTYSAVKWAFKSLYTIGNVLAHHRTEAAVFKDKSLIPGTKFCSACNSFCIFLWRKGCIVTDFPDRLTASCSITCKCSSPVVHPAVTSQHHHF